ncbi:uncharacterized protein LOC105696704 [Orussus abietinus]|uniref:uncharacterized protein LOC105696704 n=1 Tax=Orussus abietinus TaxID=222816 RepID=UPI000626B98E|nr:uncharacterized protein LOC105696704 [Orussus abietinus]
MNRLKITFFILIFSTAKCHLEVGKTLQKLEHIMSGIHAQRYSRNTEEDTRIWHEYEFGTGVGNREELRVTNITVEEDPSFLKGDENWQVLKKAYEWYLIGTEGSIVSVFHFDRQIGRTSKYVSWSIPGKVTAFRAIDFFDLDERETDIEFLVVLCVGSSNGWNLEWYVISDGKEKLMWSWPILKRMEGLEYFRHGGYNKLLLMNEPKEIAQSLRTVVDVYGFNIVGSQLEFWFSQSLTVPQIYGIHVSHLHEHTMVVLEGSNNVLLYEFRNVAVKDGELSQFQNITSNGLKNVLLFESGYTQYLAISGPEAGLYIFYENEFQFDSTSENLFDDIGEVSWMQSVPMDTYREESLLLVQLKNGTLVALSWQGQDFKRIPLPNSIIRDLDLSKAVVLPKFGLVYERRFVNIHTELTTLQTPLHGEMERMVQLKNSLKEIFCKQNLILSETEAKMNGSYFVNPNITGFWQLSEIHANTVTLTENVAYQSLTLNSKVFTAEDIQTNFNKVEKVAQEVHRKSLEIDAALKNLVPSNSTDVVLEDVEIFGNFEISGTLAVQNLTIDKLNGIPLSELRNEYRDQNVLIKGLKKFPSIEAENLKVNSINGVPIGMINFATERKSYEGADLSKLKRLVVNGNLNLSSLNGVNWENLMKSIVWKNKPATISGTVTVEGEVTADSIKLDNLNGLAYPTEFVMEDGTRAENITGMKSIEKLTVSSLTGVDTLNRIPMDDFVCLDKDQILPHEITFDDLIIEETLQIDGKITGLSSEQPGPTLEISNKVTSNVLFSNLHVMGNVDIEKSLAGKTWSEFDDLVKKTEEVVKITGKKTFLEEVQLGKNTTVSGKINGHVFKEFLTLDTEQEFPELEKISGNVTFGTLERDDIKMIEILLNQTNSRNQCFDKTIVFKSPLTVEKLDFGKLNDKITKEEFDKLHANAFREVHFDQLKVNRMNVKDLQPRIINGINMEEFVTNRVSRTGRQNMTGLIEADHLETDFLEVQFINDISTQELESLKSQMESRDQEIVDGVLSVDTLFVNGTVRVKKINGRKLEEFFLPEELGDIIFDDDVSIQNLTVMGFVNGLNFTEFVNDAVKKTDTDIVITGEKEFESISCNQLEVENLNGRPVDTILDPGKHQILAGPIFVKGHVNVENTFDTTGMVNDVLYKDLINRVEYLDGRYELRGDFTFTNDTIIEHLYVSDAIQNVQIEKFLQNVIRQGESAVITGTKTFDKSAVFKKKLMIVDTFNGVDLKTLAEKVVFIDKPFSINNAVNFTDNIVVEQELIVKEDLKCNSIKDVDLNELLESAIFLSRSTYILGSMTFNDAVFNCNLKVEEINDIDTSKLIPLRKDRIIIDGIRAKYVKAKKMEIHGLVNEHALSDIYADTFMLIGDQEISGNISFLGDVSILRDLNVTHINSVDMSKTISLDGNDTIVGNVTFIEPLVLKDSLRVLGLINEIDPLKWQAAVISTSFPMKQTAFGNWKIHGNVYFNGDVTGEGLLNQVSVKKWADEMAKRKLETDLVASDAKADAKTICEDLNALKKYAEVQIYRYKYFEYLRIFSFNQSILSVHHFESNGLDYLLVNFDTCRMNAFMFDGVEFVDVNIPEVALIHRWITFDFESRTYFLTIGAPGCGRNSGNLWKFEGNEFTHVQNFGDITDIKKINDQAFFILVNNRLEKWNIETLSRGPRKYPAAEGTLKIIPNSDRILLTDGRVIYEYNSEHGNSSIFSDHCDSGEIISFKTGIFEREMFLSYDANLTPDYVFIFSIDYMGNKVIQQVIPTYKPRLFTILNFDGFIENFLIFVENNDTIQIYEYKGIEGFVHREGIRMEVEKLSTFKLRKRREFLKRHCLLVVRGAKLIILEAQMWGERPDVEDARCNRYN